MNRPGHEEPSINREPTTTGSSFAPKTVTLEITVPTIPLVPLETLLMLHENATVFTDHDGPQSPENGCPTLKSGIPPPPNPHPVKGFPRQP